LGPEKFQAVAPTLSLDKDGGVLSCVVGEFTHQFTFNKYRVDGSLLWSKSIASSAYLAGLKIISADQGYLIPGASTSDLNLAPNPILIKLNTCLELEWAFSFNIDQSGNNFASYATDAWLAKDGKIWVQVSYLNGNNISFFKLNPADGSYSSAYTIQNFKAKRFHLNDGRAICLGTSQEALDQSGFLYDKLNVYTIDSLEKPAKRFICYGDRKFPASQYADFDKGGKDFRILARAGIVETAPEYERYWSWLIVSDSNMNIREFINLTDTSREGIYQNPIGLAKIGKSQLLSISIEYGNTSTGYVLISFDSLYNIQKDTVLYLENFGFEEVSGGGAGLAGDEHVELNDGSVLVAAGMAVKGGKYRSIIFRINELLAFDGNVIDEFQYDTLCKDTMITSTLILNSFQEVILSKDSFNLTEIDSAVFTDPLGIYTKEKNVYSIPKPYPNPTSSIVYVDLPEKPFELVLFGIDGKRRQSWKVNGARQTPVLLGDFETGVYLLHIEDLELGSSVTFRIVVVP